MQAEYNQELHHELKSEFGVAADRDDASVAVPNNAQSRDTEKNVYDPKRTLAGGTIRGHVGNFISCGQPGRPPHAPGAEPTRHPSGSAPSSHGQTARKSLK